jgi:hypothetical protein
MNDDGAGSKEQRAGSDKFLSFSKTASSRQTASAVFPSGDDRQNAIVYSPIKGTLLFAPCSLLARHRSKPRMFKRSIGRRFHPGGDTVTCAVRRMAQK